MVHKKYTYKNGKRYGPYLYETKRVGDKIITTYLGPAKKEKPKKSVREKKSERGFSRRKKSSLFVFLFVLGIFFLFFISQGGFLTGNVALDVKSKFNEGEILKGKINFVLKSGELIPKDSKVVVSLGDGQKEFKLSEIVDMDPVSGNFYAEGFDLGDSGDGYGLVGEKEILQNVSFDLFIYEGDYKEDNEDEVKSVALNDSDSSSNISTNVTNATINVTSNVTNQNLSSVNGSEVNVTVNSTDQNVSQSSNASVTNSTVVENNSTSDSQNNSESSSETNVSESSEEVSESPSDSNSSESEKSSDSSSSEEEGSEESSESAGEEFDSEESSEDSTDSSEESSDSSEGDSESGGPGITGLAVGSFNWITGNVVAESDSGESGRIIPGTVNKKEKFRYKKKIQDSARIVEGSVKIDGEVVDEDILNLKMTKRRITVTTKHYVSEKGFGEEYLGKKKLRIKIPLKDFGFVVQNDTNLNVKLVYEDEVLVEASKDLSVVQNESSEINESNATIVVANLTNQTLVTNLSNLSLIKKIPEIKITNGSALINLGDYFSGAQNYSFISNNITAIFNDSVMNLTPGSEFKGIRKGKVIASFGNESLESNLFEIFVGSGDLEVKTKVKTQIRVGQPVRWIKNVSLDLPENITVELPKEAGNITVRKIEEGVEEELKTFVSPLTGRVISGNVVTGEVITGEVISGHVSAEIEVYDGGFISFIRNLFDGFSITGRAIESNESSNESSEVSSSTEDLGFEVVLNNSATDYVIEYETEAPQAFEKNISLGKEVIISGPDELNYTEVISFTNIPEVYQVGEENRIKIYWQENGSYVNFTASDLDSDNYLDYVEWITPHLSNQTFEIILIVKAEHLDSNKTFIEDIYEEVKEQDGNWTGPINESHYIRTWFEKNLTEEKDITIYVRNTQGLNTSVEVYYFNSSEKITEFPIITNESYYKILLTGMNGSSDVFDLKIVNSENDSSAYLEFDHIIDPIITSVNETVSDMIVYRGGGDSSIPEFRRHNSSGFGGESTAGDVIGAMQYVKVIAKPNATSDEKVFCAFDGSADVNCQVWNGSDWGTVTELSTAANTKGMDLTYQSVSQEALICYRDNSVVSTSVPVCSIWNGTDFGTEFTAGDISSGISTMELIPDRNSDYVAMVTVDGANDVNAQIWNGTDWGDLLELETGSGGCGRCKKYYGAWESVEEDFVVAWFDVGVDHIQSREFDKSSGWGGEVTAITDIGIGSNFHVHMASNPNPSNNEILLATATDSDQIVAISWNGSDWGTRINITGLADLGDSITSNNHPWYLEYEGTGDYEGMIVYGVSQTDMRYRTWNGTGWSAEGFLPNLTEDRDFYQLAQDNFTERLQLTSIGVTDDVDSIEWNGTDWASSWDSLETSSNDAYWNAWFTYDYEDEGAAAPVDNPPNISYAAPTEANGSTLNRSNIQINVTAADETSLDTIIIRLFNSSNDQINSSTTTSSPNFVNFTGLSDGTYYFNASANDSSNNLNFTETRTIVIDTTAPVVNVTSPLEDQVFSDIFDIELNFTVVETNLDSCFYSLNNAANVTLPSCANSSINASVGSNVIIVYANDSLGNLGSSTRNFNATATTDLELSASKETVEVIEEFDLYANYTFSNGSAISNALCNLSGDANSFVTGVAAIPTSEAIHPGTLDIYENNTLRVDFQNVPLNMSSYDIVYRAHRHSELGDDFRIYFRCDNNYTFDSNYLVDTLGSNVSVSAPDWGTYVAVFNSSFVTSSNCSILAESFGGNSSTTWMFADVNTTLNLNNTYFYNYTDGTSTSRGGANKTAFADIGYALTNDTQKTLTFNSTLGLYSLYRIHEGTIGSFVKEISCSLEGYENQTANITITIEDNVSPIAQVNEISPNPASFGVDNVSILWVGQDLELDTAYVNVTYPNGTFLVQSTEDPLILNTTQLSVIGTYAVNVFANDTSGLTSTANSTFSVIDADSLSVVNVTADPTEINQTQTTNISAIVTDDFGVDSVLSNITFPNGSSTLLNMNNETASTYNVTFTPGLNYPLGRYNVTIIANDTSNNINSSETTSFNVSDITPPSVFELIPTNGSEFNTSNVIEIGANVSDNVLVDLVFANITLPNGTVNQLTLNNASAITQTDADKFNNSFTILEQIGTYTIRFIANDSSNNINSTEVVFIVGNDVQSPLFSSISNNITNGTAYVAGQVYDFDVTWTDNIAVETVFIEFNGVNTTSVNESENVYNFSIVNLAAGAHTYTWYANDTSGNDNQTGVQSYTVSQATSEVNLSINNSESNLTILQGDTIDLNATQIAGDSGATLLLFNNGTLINNGTSPLGNSTTFNDLGLHNITAIYVNSQNFSQSSESFFVTVSAVVDAVNPNITFVALTESNNSFLSRSHIQVNVTAADDVGLDTIIIRLFNSTNNQINSSTSSTSPLFVNFTGLSEGVYYINATANDSSNNLNATETRIVTLDTTNPGITFVAPTETDGGVISIGEILVNITSTDTNLANITIFLLNSTNDLINSTVTTSSPNFVNFSGLVDGIYFFNATAYDLASNLNSTDTRNVTIDTTSPAVFELIPINGTTFNVSNVIEIGANATDGTSVDSVLVQIGLPNGTLNQLSLNNSAGGDKYNNTFTLPIAGLYNVTFAANDSAANFNNTEITFFEVVSLDTVNPNVTSLTEAPADPATYSFGATYEFNATVLDDAAVGVVLLEFDGVNSTISDSGAGVYNFTTSNLAVGTYAYRWYANDTSGNVNSTENATFIINQAASEVNLSINNSESNLTILQGNTIDLNGTTLSGDSGHFIQLYNNGTLINNATSPVGNSTTFNNLGLHNITVIYIASQNFTRSSETFFVNVTAVPDVTSPNISYAAPTESDGALLNRSNIQVNVSALDGIALDSILIFLFNSSNDQINSSTTTSSPNFVSFASLSDGIYFFNATANDTSNNLNSTETRNVTLDTTPPAVFDLVPVNGSNFNASNVIEISANVTDVVLVDTVLANVGLPNGTINQVILNNSVGDKYNNSYTIPTIGGLFNITFVANDSINNINNTEVVFLNVTGPDLSPPAITNVTTNPALPFTNNGSEQNLSVNFTSDEFPINVTFNAYNSSGDVVDSQGPTQVNGSSELPINYVIPGTLPDGSFTLNMTANDSSDNSGVTELGNFNVDSSAPSISGEITINESGDIGGVVERGDNVSFNVTVSDATNVSNVWITIWQNAIGGVILFMDFLANIGGNLWSITVQTNETFPVGNLNYTIYANDTLGFESNVSNNFTIEDTIVPSNVQFVAPSTAAGNFSQDWIAANVTSTVVDLNIILIELFNSTQDLINSTSSGTSPVFINFTGLSDGTYYLNATSNDTAGNSNSTETRIITLDNINPGAAYVAPTESDGTLLNRNNVQVNVTASDTNLINVTIFLFNSTQDLINSSLTTSSPNFVNFTGLTDGLYFFNATAFDVALNTNSTSTRNVTIDTGAPTFSSIVENPANGTAYSSGALYVFNVTVSDPSIETVFIEFNGSNFTSEVSNIGSVYSFNRTNLAAGIYDYVWYANDTFGNSNQTSQSYTISKATSSVNLTLDNAQSNITILQGSTIDLNGTTITGDSSAFLALYNNQTLINNGTSPIGNSTTFGTVGLFNITLVYQTTQNFTRSSETLFVNVTPDITSPDVIDLIPVEDTRFNLSGVVEIAANVTDNVATDSVLANVTFPNGTVSQLTLSNVSAVTNTTSDKYNSSFTIPSDLPGQYNVTFIVNDSSNNFNNSETTFFKANVRDVNITIETFNISLISNVVVSDASGVLFNETNSSNAIELTSGFYNITITPTNGSISQVQILNLDATASISSSVNLDDSPDNPSNLSAINIFAVDYGAFNFSNSTVILNPAVGDRLYKCPSWNITTRTCTDDDWTLFKTIVPGQIYNISLLPGDPGFLETAAVADVAVSPISNESFAIAFVDTSEGDISFKIMNTNGSEIVGITDVDTTADNSSRVALTPINETEFAIAWVDGPSDNVSIAKYYTNGTNIITATDITDVVSENTDVGIAQLGDRFVVCYADDDENDMSFQIFFNNGTQAVAETDVDPTSSHGLALQNIASCSAINSSRWSYFWFDDGANDATYDILNETGGILSGPTDVDGAVGETAQVDVVGLDGDKFAMVFYDSTGDDDVTISVRDVGGTEILAPTDIDTDAGTESRVAIANVRNNSAASDDFFVVSWFDQASLDIKAAVYNGTGSEVTAPFSVDNLSATFRLLDVGARDSITGNSICPGTFVVAYSNDTDRGVFKTFYVNGSEWNGNCPADNPPNITYVAPTEANGSTLNRSNIQINVTAADETSLDTIIIRLFNSSNDQINSSTSSTSPNFVNFTGLSDGTYFFNASANDSSNNLNFTETRTVVIDAAPPNVTGLIPSNGTDFNVSEVIEIGANITDDVLVETALANVGLPNGTVNQLTLSNLSNKYNSSFSIPNLLGLYNVSFVVNDTSNNLNNTEIVFFDVVDNVGPVIGLINSGNGVTFSSTSEDVSFQYNVTEFNMTGGNCSLILNGSIVNDSVSANYTVNVSGGTNTFVNTLGEGSYSWNVSCVDGFGNTGVSATRTFTISAPSVSTGGGGGGGGSAFRPSEEGEVIVNPKELEIYAVVGEESSSIIEVINNDKNDIDFTIRAVGKDLQDVLSFDRDVFRIESGDNTQIKILVEPVFSGLLTGIIEVSYGSITENVTVVINSRSKNLLFDAFLFVPEEFRVVEMGEILPAHVHLLQIGNKEKAEVIVNYVVKDFNGEIFLEESESFFVDAQRDYVREFSTESLPLGKYVVGLELIYSGAFATSSIQFEVVDRFGPRTFFVAASLIAILVALFVTFMIPRGSKRQKGKRKL